MDWLAVAEGLVLARNFADSIDSYHGAYAPAAVLAALDAKVVVLDSFVEGTYFEVMHPFQ